MESSSPNRGKIIDFDFINNNWYYFI
jgi:hypothetical protein